jgi:hypothetical protein
VTAETLDMFPDLPHPEPVPPPEQLSADRRRTIRQRGLIAAGRHPLAAVLTNLRLHPDAGRPTGPGQEIAGPTCGTCVQELHALRLPVDAQRHRGLAGAAGGVPVTGPTEVCPRGDHALCNGYIGPLDTWVCHCDCHGEWRKDGTR